MTKAHEYAALARKMDVAEDWVNSEKYYLLAAQEISTSKVQEDVRNRKMWDAAAKRARRLQGLTR